MCELLPVNTRRSTRLSRHVNWTLRRRWVIHTIRSLRYPLGIFCYNDCVAADIVDACIEAGIQIPDQVAVLGVDNDPVICDCVQVPLSSVRHDLEGMAYEAAALLDRLINGDLRQKYLSESHQRESSRAKAPRFSPSKILKASAALRYIQGNFPRGNLSVDDVVAHGRLPRRSLERAFRDELQRTMLHEILAGANQPRTKALGDDRDFRSPILRSSLDSPVLNHFFRVFHGRTGLTPRAFRLARQLAH